jgi:hypothetical protein
MDDDSGCDVPTANVLLFDKIVVKQQMSAGIGAANKRMKCDGSATMLCDSILFNIQCCC